MQQRRFTPLKLQFDHSVNFSAGLATEILAAAKRSRVAITEC